MPVSRKNTKSYIFQITPKNSRSLPTINDQKQAMSLRNTFRTLQCSLETSLQMILEVLDTVITICMTWCHVKNELVCVV